MDINFLDMPKVILPDILTLTMILTILFIIVNLIKSFMDMPIVNR